MDLRSLEAKYGDFYVPAFTIKVGSQDLVRTLFLTVTSVEIDLKLKAPGRFSFTVANSFDWESRAFVAKREKGRIDLMDLFAFGSPIEINLGYGDPSKLTSMMVGTVTEISTSFNEGGTPNLSISGYDKLYPLTLGKNTRHWEDERDSKAVSDIAGDKGLSTNVMQTDPVKPRIDQNQESNIGFIGKLAKRNGVIFYINNGALYFGPRKNERDDVLELAWGKGLLSFSPEVNLAKQITSVEVHGWSAEKGKSIVGRAKRGDETGRDSRRKSGADRITSSFGSETIMRVRAAVHTQAEADARARAILEERGEEFVKGSGESIGVPDIVPDINIALTGLGTVFSKTYYVNESNHKVDANGYRTTFKIEETTV